MTQLDGAVDADASAVEAFAERVLGVYRDGMVALMIDLGHRVGLFDAATAGPATSAELADRAGVQERYTREWLGAMVTAGIFGYDPASGRYDLPAAHAVCLAGPGAGNVAPVAQVNTHLASHLGDVAVAFRDGGGVPYSVFRPEFTGVMDAASRGNYDGLLLDAWVPSIDGLAEVLTAGARVADVGCGTGHAMVLLGGAFPRSTFVGYDFAADAIELARAEAASAGLTNVSFEVQDAATLAVDDPFDVVMSFDAIHDQVDPVAVLACIHDALRPGGRYVMLEPSGSSNVEDNIGHPLAPWVYGVSVLHCMTVSLAHGGAGLGTMWGRQRATAMLEAAGFGDVEVHEAPGDPLDSFFVATA
jgi:SAM-dependent methyltransferase